MDDSYIVYDCALDLPVEFVAFRASLENMYKSIYETFSRWLQLLGVGTVVLYWLSEQNYYARFDLLFVYAQAVQRLSALIVLLNGMEGRIWQLKFALVSFVYTFLLSCIVRLIKLYLVTCYDASSTEYWTVVAELLSIIELTSDNCVGILLHFSLCGFGEGSQGQATEG